jgi:DNA mismatch repair protein MutL
MNTGSALETGLIRRLPPDVFNKIAAGEVVQRPGSVVKELLDNAIDAGATVISVRVENAGRTLIRVTDNGCGIAHPDLKLAFEPHATSKIASVDDLFHVQTLGFRGEALASIASVSQVQVTTKRHEDAHGWQMELWGGEEKQLAPAPGVNGTSVTVKNLFFNVPARRAFLKADQTELRHCAAIFQSLALAYPEIAFRFETEGETVFDMPSQTASERIAALFGREFKASLIAVREETPAVTVYGYLGDPKLVRKTRGEQFLFVNKRPFQHRLFTRAVLDEYSPWLGEELFPFFALFFSIPSTSVDVNVHPAKLEVKFDDERGLSALVRSVVKKALFSRFGLSENQPGMPSFSAFDASPFSFQSSPQGFTPSPSFGMPGFSRKSFGGNQPATHDLTESLYGGAFPSQQGATLFSNASSVNASPKPVSRSFWQLHNSYIVTQTLTGMCLIDQNVAHRRILFEKALDAASTAFPLTQQVLFPQTLEFSASDFQLLRELEQDINHLGFNVQLVSGNAAILSGVPADVEVGDEKTVLHSILSAYQDLGRKVNFSAREKLAAAMAKRLAIPKGKRLSEQEMETLADRLFACKSPFNDATGKPTLVYISLEEMAQRFNSPA